MHNAPERPFNSWDALKVLALLLMFIDHSGAFFFTDQNWLRAIGRGAAPIFLFLAGYASSYRFKWDIFVLGALLTLSDTMLAGYVRTQNILFTILICRAIFAWLDKRGKKIERPYEWYIAALSLIVSEFVFQYGSFGFLFAMCGYMQRRPELYDQKLRHHFMILTFLTYAAQAAAFSTFTFADDALMIATLYPVYMLFWNFKVQPMPLIQPSLLERAGKFLSYYSGYIYALHLIVLEWVSGIPI